MKNSLRLIGIVVAVLLLCSCSAETVKSESNESVQQLQKDDTSFFGDIKETLCGLGCSVDAAIRFADWIEHHPTFQDKIEDADMELKAFEDGTLRLRFITENNDRFSKYADDASQTVIYQLWDVDGHVMEGISGVAQEKLPVNLDAVYEQKLAGFHLTCPLWYMDLDALDGFYAIDPACASGFAANCSIEGSGLNTYSNGEVTLCFTAEGGPEILLHIHVHGGDTTYHGVGLGDTTEELIEALEQDAESIEPWIIEYPERPVCRGNAFSLEFAETDGVLTEFWLYAYM